MKPIERLFEFFDKLRIKPGPFEKKYGFSNGYFAKTLNRQASIGSDIIERLIVKCPDLNIYWLFTGHGKMLFSDELGADFEENLKITKHNYKLLIKKQVVGDDNQVNANYRRELPVVEVKYVPEAALADFATNFTQNAILELLPSFTFPGLDDGNYFAFNVEGDSMHNTLSNGDIVIAKQLMNPRNARNGEIYVLNTKEGFFIKRVKKMPGEMLLTSDNKYYVEEDSIPMDWIRSMYAVKRVVSANFGPKGQMEKEMLSLYKEVRELKARKLKNKSPE